MQHLISINQPAVVVVGIGELGTVFSRGFLRLGRAVVPVTRDVKMTDIAIGVEDPELVLVAVGEATLPDVLSGLPEVWRDRIALIQNELLPTSWAPFGLDEPTIASVWFEKKAGQDSRVIIPSPVAGPHADVVIAALESISIPARRVDSTAILHELVVKNMYILTSNIGGLDLPRGTTVGELYDTYREYAELVFDDVLAVQEALVGHEMDRTNLMTSVETALAGDPNHKAMGRSAPARLGRILAQAHDLNVAVPTLDQIAARTG